MDELGGAENALRLNMKDEIVENMVCIHNGEVTWVPLEQRVYAQTAGPPPPVPKKPDDSMQQLVPDAPGGQSPSGADQPCMKRYGHLVQLTLLFILFFTIGATTGTDFLINFLVFVLAIVIGYMVIWNVTPALHTPLMSVTNAISGIIVIGAMLELSPAVGVFDVASFFGLVSVFLASINVVGGFVVTQRMLNMFHKT
jgi:NAD(P) transhydrogenase subunit alpha